MNPKSLATSALTILAMLSMICLPAHAQKEQKEVFGKGHPFTIDELPDGPLKTKLSTLKAAALNRAMDKLHDITFANFDAAQHLRADNNGGIFFVCPQNHAGCKHPPGECDGDHEGETEPAPEPENLEEPAIEKAPVSVDSPPAYNSKPDAPYHIYLDFNGATVSGKAWNDAFGYATWNCRVWTLDGDRTTFSDLEQNDMREIWERIAEDYAPFNINVTTDVSYDPDNYTGDKNRVGWLLFTETIDKNGNPCPHNGSGGIAYVDVFGAGDYHSNYQPAWVTAEMQTAYEAEAGSHEIGHNMGLSHDGTGSAVYYSGHPATPDAPSWGPLMGTGYNRDVSQWSKGEYKGANLAEDDLAIIAGKVGYRTDEHGDSFIDSTPLLDAMVNVSSVIERTNDAEYFSFTTGAGIVNFDATTYRCASDTWGGNLDISLELYDESFNLVASSTEAGSEVNASISESVAEGDYFLVLKPTAAGNPTATSPSGYTVYGSLGQYTLSGNYVPTDSIILINPNGGESWFQGVDVEIVWSSGIGGDVKIELFKGGALDTLISASTPNDGSFTWTVPAGQSLGDDYKITVTSLEPEAKSDSSLDFFSVAEPPPYGTLPYTESFEGGFGLWNQTGGEIDWLRRKGWTPSSDTGPEGGFDGNHYLYTEASHGNNNKTADVSAWFNLSGGSNATLSFFYSMYGEHMGRLEVLVSPDGANFNTVFSRVGATGTVSEWHLAQVDLSAYAGQFVMITFRSTTGPDYKSDIAIDMISIGAELPEEYLQWASGSFAATFTNTALESDQDGDSLTNLMEFAFGTDPTKGGSEGLSYVKNGDLLRGGKPTLENFSTEVGDFDLRAVFSRRKDYQMAGLSYDVEFSADLKDWVPSTATPSILTNAESNGDYEAVSVPFLESVPANGGTEQRKPQFFRVRVQ